MCGYTTNPGDRDWRRLRPLLVAGLALIALALAACGGNDDNNDSGAAASATPAQAATEQSAAEATPQSGIAQADAAVSTDDANATAEDEDVPSDEPQIELEEAEAPVPDFPLTVTDDTGISVTLKARPQRVIAVLPSAVDLVVDLGLTDQLIAVDDFSLDRAPNAVSIGGSNFTFNIEAVAELEPDLLIVATGGTEELVQQARELGLPVYAIGFPGSLQDVFDQLRVVGRLLGEERLAGMLAAELEDRLLVVTGRVAAGMGAGAAPLRVYLEVDQTTPTQPFSVGPGSLHQELIELAGGVNIFADAEGSFPQVNWESIIDRDPEVILLLDSKELGGELAFNPVSAEEVGQRTGWNLIRAVRNELVVPLPNDLFSVGVRLVDALEQVADTLAEARALLAEDDAA